MGVTLRSPVGPERTIDNAVIDRLREGLRGSLLEPGAPGYDDARVLWNAMIDRHPGLIARCASTSDVVHTVNFAREEQVAIAIRGGGHNIAGSASVDGGLVIDLSPMRRIDVDPQKRLVRADAGITLAELDAATQAHGLATPVGVNSTTGLAGLTLGGGFGWLSRKYGLTVDNLVSAEVVTARGDVVRASAAENPDLFWGIRGGGGNFGVVTSFELRLHPVGPQVLAGLVVYPLDLAPDLLRFHAQHAPTAPDELSCWVVLRLAPPSPSSPRSGTAAR